MYLSIGIWGGKERVFASFKFFLYTLLGSILMLIAMIVIWDISGTTDITQLLKYEFESRPFYILGIYIPSGIQTFLWLGFFASFASGIFACKWMIAIVRKSKLKNFSYYCIFIGIFSIYYGLL